jgi:DNA-binding SARP family transcriptional activator
VTSADRSRHTHSLEAVFEYYASEQLSRVEPETVQVLLATACLPSVTDSAAAAVSGVAEASRLLARFHRQNLFTVRHASSPPAFVYHPLFRTFLLRQAEEKLRADEISALRQRAARALAEAGQAGDAMSLLQQEGDWKTAVPVVIERAPELLAKGQIPTLVKWLAWLPEEAFLGNAWLLFWKASALLFTNPDASLPLWCTVFERFRAAGDAAGVFLSWAGAVQAITLQERDCDRLDPWLQELEALERSGLSAPSPEVEAKVVSAALFACYYKDPGGPIAGRWLRRAQDAFEAARGLEDQALLGSTLIFYQAELCEFRAAEETFAALRRRIGHVPDPVLRFRLLYSQAFLATNAFASVRDVSAAVDAGLRVAEESGISLHRDNLLLFGVVAALLGGDRDAATRYLNRARDAEQRTPHAEAFYQWTHGWFLLEFSGAQTALPWAERCLGLVAQLGAVVPLAFAHHAMAMSLIELGRMEEAGEHIQAAENLARTKQLLPSIETNTALVRACWLCQENREQEAQTALAEALRLARGSPRLASGSWVPRRWLSRLCSLALEADIQPDFVRAVIEMHRLAPVTAGPVSLSWPWPVRFSTLGRFEIFVNGQVLSFTGRSPKVPLKLARILLAAGGRPVPQSQLLDALWPEADGDAGKRALDTAVHRLRRLLTRESAILTRDSALQIAHDDVFVDAWQVESLASEIADLVGRGTGPGSPDLDRRLTALLDLYQGHFLPGDDDLKGVLTLRDRLRRAFGKALVDCGQFLEKRDLKESALAVYDRGLRVDDSAEALYQRALVCHMALGQRAEAVRLYDRCRHALSRTLGIEPSSETKRALEGMHRST